MNICAVDFPAGINELEKAGLTPMASSAVKVPRIAEAPAALECRELTALEVGRSRVILGTVHIFVRDQFVDPSGPCIRAEALQVSAAKKRLTFCANWVLMLVRFCASPGRGCFPALSVSDR